MFSKVELIAGGLSIAAMAFALYLVQQETRLERLDTATQQSAQLPRSGVIVAGSDVGVPEVITNEVETNSTMKIDDITIGTGPEVKLGDVVAVHYSGTLQDGTEFDNSMKRNAPLEFTIGAGRVIEGWEEGLIGMQVGGERVLIIPPEKAYGEQGIGPIPPNATLVFTIELLEIK